MNDTTTTQLPDGAYSCGACGIATTSGPLLVLDVIGREGQLPPLQGPTLQHVTVSRCPECLVRSAQAAAVVASPAMLGTIRRMGSPSVAEHRVTAALDGAAALAAVTGTRVRVPMDTPRDLGAALTHLVAPGVAARWSPRLSPFLLAGAGKNVCTVTPWAHLDAAHVDALWQG